MSTVSLSVVKLKKKKTTKKTAARKRLCLCTDVNVQVVYNLSHVKTERTHTPAQLQTLVKSCQLSSLVFTVRSTNQQYPGSYHQPYPSRCLVKRSAVLLFVSTQITDLQNVFCFKKIDQLRMLLRLDFSTIFIVCFSTVCRMVTIFDCRYVLLGGMHLHRH